MVSTVHPSICHRRSPSFLSFSVSHGWHKFITTPPSPTPIEEKPNKFARDEPKKTRKTLEKTSKKNSKTRLREDTKNPNLKKSKQTNKQKANPFLLLQDPYPLIVRLPCHPSHLYDLECITPWLKLHTTCPLDRTELLQGKWARDNKKAKNKREEGGEKEDDEEDEDEMGMYGWGERGRDEEGAQKGGRGKRAERNGGQGGLRGGRNTAEPNIKLKIMSSQFVVCISHHQPSPPSIKPRINIRI